MFFSGITWYMNLQFRLNCIELAKCWSCLYLSVGSGLPGVLAMRQRLRSWRLPNWHLASSNFILNPPLEFVFVFVLAIGNCLLFVLLIGNLPAPIPYNSTILELAFIKIFHIQPSWIFLSFMSLPWVWPITSIFAAIYNFTYFNICVSSEIYNWKFETCHRNAASLSLLWNILNWCLSGAGLTNSQSSSIFEQSKAKVFQEPWRERILL